MNSRPCIECGSVASSLRSLPRAGCRLHHDAAIDGGGLQPDCHVVVPRLFHDAGSRMAIAGKWQVNNLYDEHGILGRHGFEAFLVWPGAIDRDLVAAAGVEKF